MTGITNHEKFRNALNQHVGEILTTDSIRRIVWKHYDQMADGSNHPSEHAGRTNKTPCKCAGTEERIFDRIQRGKYLVRPS